MPGENTKLSSSMTVRRYRALESDGDRAAIGRFIIERFDERYFYPVENSRNKHGFTIMAVACLIIETLESFYQGRADTKGKSGKMFRDFFERNRDLAVFGKWDNWFFTDIRCGILHQAETRRGRRICRSGPLLDIHNKTINAATFLQLLRDEVRHYASKLETDDPLWEKFRKKMNAVCKNCQ